MANQSSNNLTLTHQHLDRVSDLLASLKDEARKAAEERDMFMLGVYKQLLAVASPIVTSAFARLEREERAEINKEHKALRKQLRGTAPRNEP